MKSGGPASFDCWLGIDRSAPNRGTGRPLFLPRGPWQRMDCGTSSIGPLLLFKVMLPIIIVNP